MIRKSSVREVVGRDKGASRIHVNRIGERLLLALVQFCFLLTKLRATVKCPRMEYRVVVC
jgi:hypothetical protein